MTAVPWIVIGLSVFACVVCTVHLYICMCAGMCYDVCVFAAWVHAGVYGIHCTCVFVCAFGFACIHVCVCTMVHCT